MPVTLQSTTKKPALVLVLIATQILCASFFLIDMLADFFDAGLASLQSWHFYIEMVASISLVVGIGFQVRYLLELLRQKARLEQNLSLSQAAIYEVVDAYFEAWQLTPSEKDVGNFLIKGQGISEIAELRGCAEGTVKAHLNAIYRKSGTHNRSEVLSTIIEGLMDQKPS